MATELFPPFFWGDIFSKEPLNFSISAIEATFFFDGDDDDDDNDEDDVVDDDVSNDETFLINFLGSLEVLVSSFLLLGSMISTISPSLADIHSNER